MFDDPKISELLRSDALKAHVVTPSSLVQTLIWFGALRVSTDDSNLVAVDPVLARSRTARLSS
jgi:hypothetical protein